MKVIIIILSLVLAVRSASIKLIDREQIVQNNRQSSILDDISVQQSRALDSTLDVSKHARILDKLDLSIIPKDEIERLFDRIPSLTEQRASIGSFDTNIERQPRSLNFFTRAAIRLALSDENTVKECIRCIMGMECNIPFLFRDMLKNEGESVILTGKCSPNACTRRTEQIATAFRDIVKEQHPVLYRDAIALLASKAEAEAEERMSEDYYDEYNEGMAYINHRLMTYDPPLITFPEK